MERCKECGEPLLKANRGCEACERRKRSADDSTPVDTPVFDTPEVSSYTPPPATDYGSSGDTGAGNYDGGGSSGGSFGD